MKQRRLLDTPTVRSMGFDPALRHGVILTADWTFCPEPKLESYSKLCEWDAPPRRKGLLGADSTTAQIQEMCNWIISHVAPAELHGVPMGVDWHPRSVFWGNRKAGTVMTYMMGYLTRGLELLGIPVVFFNPEEVREAFGIPTRSTKENVWDQVSFFPEEASSDVRDALILSYLVARGIHEGV